jgi:hypothetical protein
MDISSWLQDVQWHTDSDIESRQEGAAKKHNSVIAQNSLSRDNSTRQQQHQQQHFPPPRKSIFFAKPLHNQRRLNLEGFRVANTPAVIRLSATMAQQVLSAKVKSIISGDTLVLSHPQDPKKERQLSLAFVTAPRLKKDGDEVCSSPLYVHSSFQFQIQPYFILE